MKLNKIISTLLAVMMILSALASAMTVNIFAEETGSGTEAETETETGAAGGETETEAPAKEAFDHVTTYFSSPEEKLASMDLAYKKGDECLYVDKTSGEVAFVNTKTGEKLFTNPYDVASSTGNDATKFEILSQIIVTFSDSNGQQSVFTSYEEAAERGQIVVENIKGGIRVEYTIGREQSKILVPRLISMERFEEMILQPLLDVFGEELYNPRSTNTDVFDVQKILSYFMIYSVDELDLTKKQRENMENTFGGLYDDLKNSDAQYARALKNFPIIESMPVYVFDPDATEKELTRAEEIITKYCPDYTYEELEYDHILTEYKSNDSNPPVFRMALEYKVEEDGLSVRLPANGIRFNESLYTLEHIQVLPYMGAGNSAYEGYNFFPDGSGTLFDFQNLNTNQTRAVSGKVYGTDFAYHEISGTYQKTIRYPVFGIVEETVLYSYTQYNSDGEKVGDDVVIAGNIVDAIKAEMEGESVNFCSGQVSGLKDQYYGTINSASSDETRRVEKRGFVCIIEEGDALASLTTYHAGALSDYNTVKMQFTPRPKDTYQITGAISVGQSSDWTVVSERKYVGNYSMKYVMLSDAEAAAEEDVDVYDASWFGMAVAYREYLTSNGIISKLSDDELTEDIPLYIEAFGAIETTEKILSIPVTVMAPLTTFDNVEEMYDKLSGQGMKNINFKLTGFANGGMWYTMPGKLNFEKAVGGNEGFRELLDKANDVNKDPDSNLGIFPDFDFAYSIWSELFDGYSPLKHNAQTIDGRYASKRVYSATQQKYENYYDMVISPAYFAEFYEKLEKNYADKYDGVIGISVSTLGTALNSDFDEDEPYNREDSKAFTIEAFKHFQTTYDKVMTDGGNAYTWQYVDHMLGVTLDSSRYNFASEAVPFIGVVLHGSIQFAGDPLNMEGDLQYAMLKAIENGASPYFILSYQNTDVLKESTTYSKYYSIRYDIWSDDIINTYSVLNDVLSDVQNKYIIGHSFVPGAVRVPDSDELATDILKEYNALLDAHENASVLLEKELERAASIARENGKLAEEYAAEAILKIMNIYQTQMDHVNKAALHDSTYYKNLSEAYAEFAKVTSLKDSEDPEEKEQYRIISDLYYIVQHHNISLAECTYETEYAAYKAMLALDPDAASYSTYKELIDGAYSDYASVDFADATYALFCAVAEAKIGDAIKAFDEKSISKDELLKVIDTYGAALISKSNFDENVAKYLLGDAKLTDDKLIEEIVDWVKDETNLTNQDEIEEALDSLKDNAISKDEFVNAITANGAVIVSNAKFDEAIDAYLAKSTDRNLRKAVLALITDSVETAEAAYLAEVDKFAAGSSSERNLKNAISVYFYSMLDKDAIIALAEKLVASKGDDAAFKAAADELIWAVVEDIDTVAVEADVADYNAKANAYNKYLAAGSAIEYVKICMDMTFAEAFDVYYGLYGNERYEDYSNLIKKYPAACSEDITDAFYAYYDSDRFATELETAMEDAEDAFNSKGYENYLGSLVKLDWMKANRDSVTDKEFNDQQALVNQTRRGAITNIANMGLILSENMESIIGAENMADILASTGAAKGDAIASSAIKQMAEIYNTAVEYVELAKEAIYTLAKAENDYQLKYLPGAEESFLNIDTSDPDIPSVVKEAVERAQATYYYIEEDGLEPIVDGYLTKYTTSDGQPIYQSAKNSSLYYYGNYEEGYQYLKMVRDKNNNVSFEVYNANISVVGTDANGNTIYENLLNEFGSDVYFTIVDGKMNYFVKVVAGVYAEKTATVYNGELFKVLSDGTEVYKDGDVYYSENEDGTYTRYTYSRCIKSCYEEIVAYNDKIIDAVAALQNDPNAGDKTILDNVLNRMKINERISQRYENTDEDEVVDDDTASKYETENVVCVVYGNDDGSAYKTIILNYNNYAVKVEYNGMVYNIPKHYFVIHVEEGGDK